MDRKRGAAAGAASLGLAGAVIWMTLVPAGAQTPAPPGSTINGTVPTAQGNVWNGLDHQPTPSEIAPITSPKQNARVNRKLNKLDSELLNAPLPPPPKGGPSIP